MSGDRSNFDYELDIFALLVDLVERPAAPTCNTCLLNQISLGVASFNFILLFIILFSLKRIRFQYTVGLYKQ